MSTTQEYTQIAETIMSQIGLNNRMCLGIPRGTTFFLPESETRRGGVTFKFTNCFKIRNGKVEIDLEWKDTYTVRVYNQLGNLKETVEDVYNDMLADVLMRVIGY
jgi:hypothetical protein